ncbi:N-acetylglucosamine kinase [Hahella sp. CCB-MM4]|uniref:BadF/BadG/BcrA/BcrD ATPase family protein n=1 Tax=Hahella sp. (strain CCB-MM4) TaxID=1926491 RepID=UPI000B9AC3C7|nr:BadF/BadG/BcrA/BcrD ATPase family protein [Hahella sp. CCB-MM4]OZG74497.1 N-acetylglucosamine kinase [Hahella sp. CCB-MM4]
MSSEVYYLGVDGGGTSCRARLCDAAGKVLGEGTAGSANPRLGLEYAYANIIAATQSALAAAGADRSILSSTYAGLGLAGVAQQKEYDLVMSHPHPFADIALMTDAHTACLGAFGGESGAILIMGTGSCGVAYVDKAFHVVGGWGFPVSDTGSGATLGLMVLRHSLLAYEGMAEFSPLARDIMETFSNQQQNLVAWMDQAKPRDYASFAPRVFQYADKGDPVACKLLTALAEEAAVMLRRLLQLGAPKLCVMGGLSQVIKPWLPQDVTSYIEAPVGDAMDGAIRLIRQKQEAA